jgi:hypothetical protein
VARIGPALAFYGWATSSGPSAAALASQYEETGAVTMGVRAAVTSARTAPIDGPDI